MIDIQSSVGRSRFKLEAVGVTSLKYPIVALDEATGERQSTLAEWRLGVSLAAERRGTHMSRFIAELDRQAGEPMGLSAHMDFASHIASRLEAEESQLETTFTWFRRIAAPVSRQEAMIDCTVSFKSCSGAKGEKILMAKVPAKALCPCSKAISDRGAHNQRSIINVALHYPVQASVVAITQLIALVESAASSPVYPLLKREDEKYVTEMAYDNPVFAEDLARNVGEKLYDLPGVQRFIVEAVNQESIHAHDCFARLDFTR